MKRPGGGPIAIFVDLFLLIIVMAAFVTAVLFIVSVVNRAESPPIGKTVLEGRA